MPIAGTPRPDFLVHPSDDPKFLIVDDLTDYYHTEAKPSIIEIIPPGSKIPSVNYLEKNKRNVFNSNNLGLTCPHEDCPDTEYIDLPDGIYEITIKLSPDTFNKKRFYLKTDKFRLDLGKVIISNNITYDPSKTAYNNWLTEVYSYYNRANSEILYGNVPESSRYFKMAIQAIDKYSECKNCY